MSHEPIVQLTHLHAQDERGAIYDLTLSLPAGTVGGLLGTPSDGSSALARVLCGQVRPVRGSVLVDGAPPFDSPQTRSRIGVLLDTPLLPDLGTVRELLRWSRNLRQGERAREQWFEPLGLAQLEPLRVSALDRIQRRTVALGLALSVPALRLLVLHEPLSELQNGSADVLRPMLKQLADQNTCVLLLTSSGQDAVALSDDIATLQAGRISRAIGSPEPETLTPEKKVQLQVWCSQPRALATALMQEPLFETVQFDGTSTALPITVQARSLDQAALAVQHHAQNLGLELLGMRPILPTGAEVHAASTQLAMQGSGTLSASAVRRAL